MNVIYLKLRKISKSEHIVHLLSSIQFQHRIYSVCAKYQCWNELLMHHTNTHAKPAPPPSSVIDSEDIESVWHFRTREVQQRIRYLIRDADFIRL